MNQDEIQEIMKKSTLFSGADISPCCIQVRRCRKGQIISDRQQTRETGALGLVARGNVDVYSIAMDGKEIVLSSLSPGECFGMCNLLIDDELPTVLRCRTETTVLRIPKHAFLDAMKRDQGLAFRYARLCNEKMQFLLHRIEFLTMQSGRNKVIQYLLMHQDEQHTVKLNCSKESLAAMLGISRAALFRELAALQEHKLVKSLTANRLLLLDCEKLEQILYE